MYPTKEQVRWWFSEDRTLSEIITLLGMTHKPSKSGNHAHDIQCRGKTIFTGTARQATEWLKAIGEIP